MTPQLVNIRLDELPLIHHLISELNVQKSIDAVISEHGNWTGISVGTIVTFWLCYILYEGDHRLYAVEDWVEKHLDLLRVLSGENDLSSLDFTDDKLAKVLEKLSTASLWSSIEQKLNEKSLSIYRLDEQRCEFATFRLDAAPMQSHGTVKEGGLLQHGHHKQHANLPQLKVKLCTLDNELNHFAYPVTHLTVSGNSSDDSLYVPVIEQSKSVLRGIAGYEQGNLYVGDCKLGSMANRIHIVQGKDYYLMPLSLIQLSKKDREMLIKQSDISCHTTVFREQKEQKEQKEVIASGFEVVQVLEGDFGGEQLSWDERRLFVHSTTYGKAQQHAFANRLEKVVSPLENLTVHKQGKKALDSQSSYEQAVCKLLKDNQLTDFLTVVVQHSEVSKEIRGYGKTAARTEVIKTFSIVITRNEAAITAHQLLLGWQVYATNAPAQLLSFEKCVLKYRHQSNIESSFDDLRNKIAHLVPIFLQKDERIRGLVNLLLLALKICGVMEYQAAAALSKKEAQLYQIYEGSPKKGTKRPSSKKIFKAFDGIAIALIFANYQLQLAVITDLEPVQIKILQLLDIEKEVYTALIPKFQIFFSKNIISET